MYENISNTGLLINYFNKEYEKGVDDFLQIF